MRRILWVWAALAGCDGGVECTTEARGSVNVTVGDEAGQPIDGTLVVYAVDGGPAQDCEEMLAGDWVCGWEVEGDFVITAEAPGYGPAIGAATVTADECHVIPQSLTLTLTPSGS